MKKIGRIIFFVSLAWFFIGAIIWGLNLISDQTSVVVVAIPSIVGLLTGGTLMSRKRR